jgi:hypothetical protein
MTDQELNEAKHKLERDRFEFDKDRSRLEGRFLHRNFAAVISASISIAALSVSISQVWVAHIEKEREAEASATKQQIETQREQELDNRRWNYDSLQFVANNKDVIFGPNTEQQKRIIDVMIATFPFVVLDPLVRNIKEQSKDPANWKQGEKTVDARNLESSSAQEIDLPGDILSNTDQLVRQLTSPARLAVSNSLIQLHKQNPTGVISALTAALLQPSDANSYRNNLYIAVTLGRIPNGWEGPAEKIDALTKTDNYRDPTFHKWVDKALSNHKVQ